MSRPRSDSPSPAAIRKRRQRQRERAETAHERLAAAIKDEDEKRLEMARLNDRTRGHTKIERFESPTVPLKYARSPTLTMEEIITVDPPKPPPVNKYVTVEISPQARTKMVKHGFLPAGQEEDDTAIKAAVYEMFNVAWDARAGELRQQREGCFAGAG